MIPVALGVDTSCYTTSVALASTEPLAGGERFLQRRRLLEVPVGERGMQQSKAVFQHVNRLAELAEQLMEDAAGLGIKITCVAASTRPRPQEGSYMPVFTVGEGFGRAMAAALRVPFIPTSHQQGHVRAAMEGTGLPEADAPFLAMHLSGGTTELISVSGGLDIRLLGETGDLNAGQFVDRVGVALGLPFPCGPHLEALAVRGGEGDSGAGEAAGRLESADDGRDTSPGRETAPRLGASLIPSSVKGLKLSFSGAEACAQRLIAQGELSAGDIAAEVYSCLARTLGKWIVAAQGETGAKRLLIAGGVASSALLRGGVTAYLRKQGVRMKLTWARPELSGDNAVGVALIGLAHI